MASTTRSRAAALKTTKVKVPLPAGAGMGAGATPKTTEVEVVPNFAMFIDTHRDQPHVPTFEEDIHRGMTRPTLVHYVPPKAGSLDPLGYLVRPEDGRMIQVDPKHRFVELDWWNDFVTEYLLDHGEAPVADSGDQKGQMPTSHLRDARAKVYKLKSLRQIVRVHEAASATASATPYSRTAAAASIAASLGLKKIARKK